MSKKAKPGKVCFMCRCDKPKGSKWIVGVAHKPESPVLFCGNYCQHNYAMGLDLT